jgi:hypothetical protein
MTKCEKKCFEEITNCISRCKFLLTVLFIKNPLLGTKLKIMDKDLSHGKR